jgi:hypothetical protein
MGWARGKLLLALAAVVATLPGCVFLQKLDDAVAPQSATVKKFAEALAPQSSLARGSGLATWTRLKALFPSADNEADPNSLLNSANFSFLNASGISQAFGQLARPYDSLAQMALRNTAAGLCTSHLSDPATTLFQLKSGEQLLAGESAPADAPTATALAAIRNAWLHPYLPTDPEVQAVAALYSSTLASSVSEGGASGAKKAVCLAVLLAPQFWMGTPEKTDAARKVSLEFFQRVPTMQELADYASGKVTIEDYFNKLFGDSSTQAGFISTVNQWNQEWLGLRTFMDPGFLNIERRALPADPSTTGASVYEGIQFSGGTNGAGAPALVPTSISGLPASGCVSSAQQAFDPDTSMIAWEHYNYDAAKSELVGAWVRSNGALAVADSTVTENGNHFSILGADTVASKLASIGLMPFTDVPTREAALADLCTLGTQKDQEGIVWTLCGGLLTLNAAGAARVAATLNGIVYYVRVYNGIAALGYGQTFDGYNMNMWCPKSTANDSCIAGYQSYFTSVRNRFLDDLRQLSMRIKQYTPGGVVRSTALQQLLAANPYSGQLATDTAYTTFFNSYVGPTSGTVDADITSFGTAIGGGGWYYMTNIADMRNPTAVGSGRFSYSHTPLDSFSLYLGANADNKNSPIMNSGSGGAGFSQSDRIVRRLGGLSGAWQDGYSPVKLWWTGGTVNACNTADRFWASCFFRPKAVGVGMVSFLNFNPTQAGYWEAENAWLPDSALTPAAASAFYCGLPALTQIASPKLPSPDPYEVLKLNTGALNEVASNIKLYGPGAAGTPFKAETDVFAQVSNELDLEPYQLLDDLILNGGDFRELLTANYTFGSSCLEFFYDTQGYYLPAHPEAAGAACTGPGGPKVKFGPGAGIPTGHIATNGGAFQGANGSTRGTMWSKLYPNGYPDELPPRTYSGILTMPAFVAPVATTARGLASRYFQRLLCNQPNFYDLTQDPSHPDAAALHKSFISTRAHLQPACLQCHQNLDPLASALSWTFLGLLIPDPNDPGFKTYSSAGGEGGPNDFLGEMDVFMANGGDNPVIGALAGARSGAAALSNGAFMGQPVLGIRDLATKVANSTAFAQCVTQTMFTNVFGHQVGIPDVPFYNSMVQTFMDPSGANYHFLDLMKAMIKSDNFTRAN